MWKSWETPWSIPETTPTPWCKNGYSPPDPGGLFKLEFIVLVYEMQNAECKLQNCVRWFHPAPHIHLALRAPQGRGNLPVQSCGYRGSSVEPPANIVPSFEHLGSTGLLPGDCHGRKRPRNDTGVGAWRKGAAAPIPPPRGKVGGLRPLSPHRDEQFSYPTTRKAEIRIPKQQKARPYRHALKFTQRRRKIPLPGGRCRSCAPATAADTPGNPPAPADTARKATR